MVTRMTVQRPSSGSVEDHLIVKEAARLVEQVLNMGRQHARLDNRHRIVETEHNELLCHAAALEKTLAAATKNRDEAVAALESRKREKDLLASTAEREKMFEEQPLSIAKSLSDASGLSFDAQSLRRVDALAGAIAVVEDRNVSLQETLGKAKDVLSHIRENLTPKVGMIDNLGDLVESLAGGIPADFKDSQRSVGATMALAMVQAHGVEMDPAAIYEAMPIDAGGQHVVFAPYAGKCKNYGPQLIETLAKYSEERRRAKAAASRGTTGKSVASETATV